MKHDFSDYIDSTGCTSVVLGCTELPLLVSDPKIDGLLDTMQAAIDYVVNKAQ